MTSFAAVVLAGGEGARIGGNKPLRALYGVTLLDHALAFAHAQSDLVAIGLRAEGQLPAPAGAAVILDDPAVPGPLGGLAAALAYARGLGREAVLTLPCDMPRLPADLAARLDAALSPSVGAAVAESGGQLYPVCALWRTDAFAALPAYLARGKSSLWGFAQALGMATVTWPVSPADPFRNANTASDLAALEAEDAPPRGP